jgi:4-aminobutyrate aminotransferase-like enzyme
MIGAGSLRLGHGHPTVVRAVQIALTASVPNLAATEDQVEFAARLQRYFQSMERIRSTPSGTEANQALILLARAFSGRDSIAKFEGGYHGQAENVLVSVNAYEPARGPAGRPNSGDFGRLRSHPACLTASSKRFAAGPPAANDAVASSETEGDGWKDSKPSSVQRVPRHGYHLITPQAMRAPPPPSGAGLSE